ncbi:hypothetical protein EVAR_39560_1 [Eumeta japonica]|uniref:PiggyBac transposable element-derived protein domain-containing protein n=1 Tax=Eumeta variegata TaxID=151549 RepID=A0A4C1XKD7_EUMVA|nr:hypothetical protein EVAR_39560_1 [Eumeta japonica]
MASRALTDREIERILEFDGDDSTVEGLSDDVKINEHLESCLQELENCSEGSIDDSSDDDTPLAAVAARQTSSRRLYLKQQYNFALFHQEFTVNLQLQLEFGIRMYWANKTRVAMIADRMTRDRYFKLRSNLKLVNDLEVNEASKQNKFWKVKPSIETIRRACLQTS